jgi:hypothetical protein
MVQEPRTQRRSDGTVSIESVRFEIPSRYRHLPRVTVRYAGWDLTHVVMVDERTDVVLCRIWPVDKAANASGERRSLEAIATTTTAPDGGAAAGGGMAPLMRKLLAQYAATGLPPAYLPKDETATATMHDEVTP